MSPLANQPISNLINYVRLADAYQHIGKAEYGAAWADHEIGVFLKHKIKVASLADPEFIQPPQKRVIEPQYKRITSISLKRARLVEVDNETGTRHASMKELIEKLIRNDAFQMYLEDGLERKSFAELRWQDIASIHFDYLRSMAIIMGTNSIEKTYRVFVVGESLERCLKSIRTSRKERLKPDSNAGRKVTSESGRTNEIIAAVVKANPQIKVMKEIAQLAEPVLKENGVFLSITATEKRIARHKLMPY